MVYNAYSMLKDYYSYEQIYHMPLRDLFSNIEYFKPKLKEIARQQEAARLEAELTGKRNNRSPGGRK